MSTAGALLRLAVLTCRCADVVNPLSSTLLNVANEVRCFHSHPPKRETRLSDGTEHRGVVVCLHPFGLGVFLPDQETFGHVDTPMMGRSATSGLDDYPPVGSVVLLTVLGYSGLEQLRLSVNT